MPDLIKAPASSVPQNPSISAETRGAGEAVHFLDYWQILYSRKEIVIAVALIMIFTGIVVTRAMPRVYQATTIIQVQREHSDINIYGQTRIGYDPYFLRTQFEIIRSVPIMEEVVREMNLNEILGRAYGYYDRMSSVESSARTVSLLRRKVDLNIYRDTDLIAISIKLDKPDEPDGEAAKLAAATANTVAKVFKEWTLRQSREDKENALKVLQQELDEQDRKIAAQEDKIHKLREKYGGVRLVEAQNRD